MIDNNNVASAKIYEVKVMIMSLKVIFSRM
jgi:hypothetical protein